MDTIWEMFLYLFMLKVSIFQTALTHQKAHLKKTWFYILTIIQPNYFWTDIFQTAIINPHHCLRWHHQEEWLTFMLVIAVEDALNASELISAALQYSCWMCTGKTSTNSPCIVTVHKVFIFQLCHMHTLCVMVLKTPFHRS